MHILINILSQFCFYINILKLLLWTGLMGLLYGNGGYGKVGDGTESNVWKSRFGNEAVLKGFYG